MTREEAITRLHWLKRELIKGTDMNEPIDMAIEALQTEAVQGEWIYLHGSIGSYMTISCPFCGKTFDDVAEWKYNYCPNCGAKMSKGGDSE